MCLKLQCKVEAGLPQIVHCHESLGVCGMVVGAKNQFELRSNGVCA